MKQPRLQQPLFSSDYGEAYSAALNDKLMSRLIMAYDCIWNLLYEPNDIRPKDATANAKANLENLGGIIEYIIGEEAFDADPDQLNFELDEDKLG